MRAGQFSGPVDPLSQFSSLRKKQRRLAKRNQGVIQAVARGTRAAVAECQHQFRQRRWNCPTQRRMRGRRLFGRIANVGESRSIRIWYLFCTLVLLSIEFPLG